MEMVSLVNTCSPSFSHFTLSSLYFSSATIKVLSGPSFCVYHPLFSVVPPYEFLMLYFFFLCPVSLFPRSFSSFPPLPPVFSSPPGGLEHNDGEQMVVLVLLVRVVLVVYFHRDDVFLDKRYPIHLLHINMMNGDIVLDAAVMVKMVLTIYGTRTTDEIVQSTYLNLQYKKIWSHCICQICICISN